MERLFDEITKERARQEEKWGAKNARFSLGDWMNCIGTVALLVRANSDRPAEARRHLVKLVALAVRAVEAFDRKNTRSPSTTPPAAAPSV